MVHAIARSRQDPERAESILQELEQAFQDGASTVQPDVVIYDAVINAFGWANNYAGKAEKCVEIFERMVELYESGRNMDSKPDIITCNSILNACAFEKATTTEEHDRIVETVVRILEEFQARAPEFGTPNHTSYSTAINAVRMHASHDASMRNELLETLFLQCCESGNVSVLVVNNLHKALPFDRFSNLLGDALMSDASNDRLRFDPKKFPQEWTINAPSRKKPFLRRPSTKARSFQGSRRKESRT